ncbi:MAG: DUF167 domain-containing protein [Kiritimatiellae bacterium]|nr:DUF167 domain-containing protein [Kiritimatiellia bacterium]
MGTWCTPVTGGCQLTLKVVPRASKTEIASDDGEWLRVRLQAPPVDGKANAALVQYFAKLFSVPKGAVEVVTGAAARLKRVQVRGVTSDVVAAAVQQALG